MNSAWIDWGNSKLSQDQKIEHAHHALQEIEKVKDWQNCGCPLPKLSVSVIELAPAKNNKIKTNLPFLPEGQEGPPLPSEAEEDLQDGIPDIFKKVDLKAINESGQWVKFCVYLAEHGFPCDDRFLEVVSTLTRWLAFIELFNQWPDRTAIKEALRSFCLNKNNKYISRLNDGHVEDVLNHVDRVVE